MKGIKVFRQVYQWDLVSFHNEKGGVDERKSKKKFKEESGEGNGVCFRFAKLSFHAMYVVRMCTVY
jgi:hypothetical protein